MEATDKCSVIKSKMNLNKEDITDNRIKTGTLHPKSKKSDYKRLVSDMNII